MTSHDLTVRILRCRACRTRDPGPRDLCPVCNSPDLVAEEVAGAGTLVATTFIRRPPAKFKIDGAYGIAVVALDAGVRIVGRVGKATEAWSPGTRVAVIAQRDGYAIFGRAAP